jgi:hypothetical protein
MKWLSKVGSIFLKGLQIYMGVAPIATAAIPGDKDDRFVAKMTDSLTQIASIITTVEAIGAAASVPMPGPEKLRVASPLVAQIILSSSMLAQHKIQDEVLFRSGCEKVASGMADILNSIHGDPETVNKG